MYKIYGDLVCCSDEVELPVPIQPAADTADNMEEDEYDAARHSPKLIPQADIEEGTLIYNPSDDMKRLEMQRLSLKNTGKVQVSIDFLYMYL